MSYMERYRIARAGKEINEYDLVTIRSYLASGSLKPTDHAWKPGMSDWKTLSELGIAADIAPPPVPLNAPSRVGNVVQGDANSGMICSECGCVGFKEEVPGTFAMEVCLYVVFCFPGIIYSVWRLMNKGKVCTSCGSRKLVPFNSPVGRKLRGV